MYRKCIIVDKVYLIGGKVKNLHLLPLQGEFCGCPLMPRTLSLADRWCPFWAICELLKRYRVVLIIKTEKFIANYKIEAFFYSNSFHNK